MMYQEIPETDNCLGNQCAEGSTCVDGQFEYICQCPENRGGRYCQGKNEEFFLSLNDEIQSLKQILDIKIFQLKTEFSLRSGSL